MKKGDIVMVYENPITQEKPEGEAELVQRLVGYGILEHWEVKFLATGEVTTRNIKVKSDEK